MGPGQWMTAAAGVSLLTVLVLLVVLTLLRGASRRRALRAELAASRAELEGLRDRLDELAAQLESRPRPASGSAPRPAVVDDEYVITSLRDEPSGLERAQPGPVDGARFVQLAVGESMVRLASLAHGVRRALSAEQRHQIRFAMRQEVKRARRQRRRDLKEAKRHLRTHAPQRTEDAA